MDDTSFVLASGDAIEERDEASRFGQGGSREVWTVSPWTLDRRKQDGSGAPPTSTGATNAASDAGADTDGEWFRF